MLPMGCMWQLISKLTRRKDERCCKYTYGVPTLTNKVSHLFCTLHYFASTQLTIGETPFVSCWQWPCIV
jgi:hypothetical protein